MVNVLIMGNKESAQEIQQRLINRSDISIIGHATDEEGALSLARVHKPHVLLLYPDLPDFPGVIMAHKMHRYCPNIKTIAVILNEGNHINDPLNGNSRKKGKSTYASFIRAGVQGYIADIATAEEFASVILQVVAGNVYVSPEIAHQIALNQVEISAQAPFDLLSQRELQVMLLLSQGVKISSIATQLCLSAKTINTYRYRLFEKLKINNNVKLTHIAFHYGMFEKYTQDKLTMSVPA